ncbi:hypothetical protein E4T56_gene10775 [Termitomyces sp. T112]|nr:hypothetical protein E4T56_gene10775 [Termitomyces sp. T112]
MVGLVVGVPRGLGLAAMHVSSSSSRVARRKAHGVPAASSGRRPILASVITPRFLTLFVPGRKTGFSVESFVVLYWECYFLSLL